MAKDPELNAHLEWIGYVQPVGLVVSAPALLAAQAYVNKNIIPEHQRFLEHVEPVVVNDGEDKVQAVSDLPALLQEVFDWQTADLVDDDSLDSLEVVLPEYGETLRPTYAVKEIEPENADARQWQMLVQVVDTALDLDDAVDRDDHRWQASPHARFERLLRETEVPIGLLFNGTHLRLVYAPRGETSGYATFPVDAMVQVDGRPIFAALHMLLSAERLFTLPRKQRLPSLLAESRKYQSLVSTKLSEQVLNSLNELLRGFQAADDATHGELLRQVLKEDPNHVYAGLLNVLLRLVFVLYAEDRGLMPGESIYSNHYSVNGLFERLRSDDSRYPDTMDQRYGAWAQLLSLFRLIFDGASHGMFRLPPRQGHLFDPNRYPFLEGRPYLSTRQVGETLQPPMVSDGVIFRVLQDLLILDGERISYRALDVEQIGSVYEAVMGFSLEVARGRSIAVKPTKPHGAPVTINLDELLDVKPGSRAKWVKDTTGQSISGEALKALQAAATPEDAVAALGKKVSPTTPRIVPPGAMILQPSDERRRSGSHYTPRSLTEPIVRTTLRPVLEQLGDKPTPEQILDLKVCDPAMGSGAFLVEADRQLADELVKAWHNHDCVPAIPPDEDEVLFARRLVVQRCLYGVDKNPMAVDLAKLSLWLATLAKDHAFTFVDHSLKCGDSLVGLTRKQLAAFHWQPTRYVGEIEHLITERVQQAMDLRAKIQNADEEKVNETSLRLMLKESQEALDVVRAIGDLIVTAFFSSQKPREREKARNDSLAALTHAPIWSAVAERSGHTALTDLVPNLGQSGVDAAALQMFHWEIEFPEVFLRENSGFDAFVGNPPFAGKNTLIISTAPGYLDWLKVIHEESHGNADLVAHFFRRAFDLLRQEGTFGLIATNTIGQGDTRATGLLWICTHGGTIFNVRKRYKWPGHAAVVVSVVSVAKYEYTGRVVLDGQKVGRISAYLFAQGPDESPFLIAKNARLAFKGCVIMGEGFIFSDQPGPENAGSTAVAHTLLQSDNNASVIWPYVAGGELNEMPCPTAVRYVINFAEMSESEARRFSEVMEIVEHKVKPYRDTLGGNRDAEIRKQHWWRFGRFTPALYKRAIHLSRVMVCAHTGPYKSFVFLPPKTVFDQSLIAFCSDLWSFHAVLQSRVHELWNGLQSSSMKDDLRYTPTDCFETFPFPKDFETNPALESAGQEYYEFRAALMVRNNEGLTKTYNRFHDPEEQSPDILRLRELHAAMDRAVLDAYGWTDLHPTCEFLLDYEEEEDEDDTPTRTRRRKKPWRYRWPDDFRDEVLARLLELNRQYAEEERLSGATAEKGKKGSGKKRKPPADGHGAAQGDLGF